MHSVQKLITLAFAFAVLGQAQVITQIHDGQIQAVTAPIVTATISSGIPSPTANGTFTTAAPSPPKFTGGASVMSWSMGAVAAVGAAAACAML